jgi:ribosomal subunit interface protein
MDLSDGLKSAARTEADRFPRYFNRISHVEFVFEEDHNQVSTEIITSTVKGKKIVGASEDYDPFKSLKEAASKVARQLKRFNEQLHENRGEVDQSTSANPADRDRPGEELPDEKL